jgi:hypothetical protein
MPVTKHDPKELSHTTACEEMAPLPGKRDMRETALHALQDGLPWPESETCLPELHDVAFRVVTIAGPEAPAAPLLVAWIQSAA